MLYFQWDEDLSISIKVPLGIAVGIVAGMLIVFPSKVTLVAVLRQGLRLTDITVFDRVELVDCD